MAAKSHSKTADGKFADLQKDTIEVNDKQHMTTDNGVKISNPDQWLRIVDEKNLGPSLLEDQIAREKVSITYIHPHIYQYISKQTNQQTIDHALRPRTHSRESSTCARKRRLRHVQAIRERRGRNNRGNTD